MVTTHNLDEAEYADRILIIDRGRKVLEGVPAHLLDARPGCRPWKPCSRRRSQTMKLLKAVIRKEFRHILRDPRSLTIVFVMPVFMIFIYGYSISYDLNRIDAAVIDDSRQPASQRVAGAFRQQQDLRAACPERAPPTP